MQTPLRPYSSLPDEVFGERLRFCISVVEELIDDVDAGSDGDPLTGMNTGMEPRSGLSGSRLTDFDSLMFGKRYGKVFCLGLATRNYRPKLTCVIHCVL